MALMGKKYKFCSLVKKCELCGFDIPKFKFDFQNQQYICIIPINMNFIIIKNVCYINLLNLAKLKAFSQLQIVAQ